MDDEVFGFFQLEFHGFLIADLVALGARRPDCGAFSHVEHSELDGSRIGYFSHAAAERVDFTDNLSFRNSAYGGITAHLGDVIHVYCEEERPCAEPRSGVGGLAAGVSATDHNNIIIILN
jgi:hypothetical protein